MVGKLKDIVKVSLPTTQTGRYPKPNWYNYNIRDRDWLEMYNEPGFLEAYTDAVRTTIIDHEVCGQDIVTDGCMRFDWGLGTIASWNTNSLAYVGGLRRVTGRPAGDVVMTGVVGKELAESYYRFKAWAKGSERNWWLAEDLPSMGRLRLWVETAKIALATSTKPLKYSGPAAAMASYYTLNKTGKSDRDVFFGFAKAQNEMLRELVNVGCKIIQLDYPFGFTHWASNFSEVRKDAWDILIQGFNEEVKGVNAHIWVHFCFGAPILYNHEVAPQTYHMAKAYPYMAECKADCIQSEAANTDGKYLDEELKAWKEYLSDKDYAVGAVTPYDLLETAEDVDKIVEKSLKYVPPDKLALTSDEGLAAHGYLTRIGAMIKMRLLTDAAKKARKKI
ncbi:MAG TPA: hypothetical protein VJZ32_00230 [Candidatus Bathyarchaeia archaeon]|nr:hypothetical protein [Candidatus Bathyarchaeia archaeon]